MPAMLRENPKMIRAGEIETPAAAEAIKWFEEHRV